MHSVRTPRLTEPPVQWVHGLSQKIKRSERCADHQTQRRLGYSSRYTDSLPAGLSGDRFPVGARFSAPVQAVPGANPASCTIGTESLSRG